jgi:hypothetical protein
MFRPNCCQRCALPCHSSQHTPVQPHIGCSMRYSNTRLLQPPPPSYRTLWGRLAATLVTLCWWLRCGLRRPMRSLARISRKLSPHSPSSDVVCTDVITADTVHQLRADIEKVVAGGRAAASAASALLGVVVSRHRGISCDVCGVSDFEVRFLFSDQVWN